MSKLNKVLHEEYGKKKSTVTARSLVEMIEELMELPPRTMLSEKAAAMTQTFTLSMIPEIEVSELGWSDVRTPEGVSGPVVKGRERQLLEAYLVNILGGASRSLESLPQQLSRLSAFYADPEQYLGQSETRSEKIKQAISMLVFYKTLTKIIANFNAASAGFSFESFLATLLDGIQVPANTGTIADFYAGGVDGTPVSLKLYNEKTVAVGGSFVDLVGDLLNDAKGNQMTYLVVMKNLKGEKENLSGTLTFYQFSFTLDNVFDIIGESKPASRATIILPLQGGELGDVEAPERIRVSPERVQETFEENLLQIVGNEDVVAAILSSPYFQYGTDEMISIASSSTPVRRYADKRKRSNIENMEQVLRGIPALENVDSLDQIVLGIYQALDQVAGEISTQRKSRKDTIAQLLPALQGKKLTKGSKGPQRAEEREAINIAATESVEYYNQLKGKPEAQKSALLKTNGYLNELQFDLNRTEVKELAHGPIATLEIGASAIQAMLDSTRDLLNTEVFAIFNSLAQLSDNLNGFFSSGLRDDQKASEAIGDAQNIQMKTEKAKASN
jgi:hypothetical protein